MGLLDGKVVLVTGGARGQGRAHAVTSAREGADVVVVDIAGQIDTVPYPMATPDDLARASSHYHALRGAGTLAPERIADAALWLNSDLASAVTGVTVPVDAGHLLLTGYNQAPAR